MSSKQLRKLQANKSEQTSETTNDVEGVEEMAPSKSGPRGFAMLVGSSDESDGHDMSEETQEKKVSIEEEENDSKSKKKKNKKKNKGKNSKNTSTDIAPDPFLEEDDDALLDKLANEAAAIEASECNHTEDSQKAAILSMSKADFRLERERKRLFGGEALKADGKAGGYGGGSDRKTPAFKFKGAHEGCFIHHRKMYITELASDEKWPRPEGCAKMNFLSDSDMFEIASTPEHTRIRTEFASVQASHDPNEVVFFVRERPFCIEALIVLAEIMRGSGEQEQGFQLIRRAVYAVECNFNSSFSPFTIVNGWPRTSLLIPSPKELSWVGWPWLGAIWSYMVGLSSQGLSRTGLEVCKLLLSMSLPRDPTHVLMHCDFLCLRAGEYLFLKRLARELVVPQLLGKEAAVARLDCMLPNVAYSVALASKHLVTGDKGGKDVGSLLATLNLVSVTDILPQSIATYDNSTLADAEAKAVEMHAALLRAMLIFPQVLRPLLESVDVNLDAPAPAKSPYRSTWDDLFSKKPFIEYREFKHERNFLAHARIADAYARARAPLWKNDATLCWLHACAGRLVKMCESSLFHSELCEARGTWSRSQLSLDDALTLDYDDISGSEFGAERQPPKIIAQAMNALVGEAVPIRHVDLPLEGAQEVLDDEEQLQRALRNSRAALQSQERQHIIDEQDREYQESLAEDRMRELGAVAEVEVSKETLAQLLEMGFDVSAAERALAATGGDMEKTLSILTS